MPTPPPPCRRSPWAFARWSLQVSSVAELVRLLDELGVEATQIACGDPHHARLVRRGRLPPPWPETRA